ncbi:Rv3654c family TadE-like protein [Promicromonospora sukumoe]|uniref:Secretion/DNA translocation related TadE-like protein n=1 Tax=Promicromonospora sukumoe TaxID=88382 RepID=A0A7W3JE11_9MICO|nr:Rv3654c family TadE-like protein [Promicromonospora sukumoe]MBA8811118.1 secretion/DNA translocation related TadE-like protein [Promicromonospora sukumoe]
MGRAVRPGRDAGREAGRGLRRDLDCHPRRDPERGAGTVLVLGVVAAALLLAVGIAALGAAQNARGAAQAAADLGALAGATALRDGFDPCGTAGAAVTRNGAELAACEVLGGGVVRVVATRAAVGPAGELGSARATARAGPRESATARP